MNQILAIILVLMMFFGFSILPDTVDFDFSEEEYVPMNIAGNDEVSISKEKEIHRVFEGRISGNAQVNIETTRGNIYLYFKDKIVGTATVNVRSDFGNIYVKFADDIEGDAKVNIESPYGLVVFVNDQYTIEGYRNKNNLTVKSRLGIRYDKHYKHEVFYR